MDFSFAVIAFQPIGQGNRIDTSRRSLFEQNKKPLRSVVIGNEMRRWHRHYEDYLLSSSMRRIGASARLRSGSGKMISGSRCQSALYTFSGPSSLIKRQSPL